MTRRIAPLLLLLPIIGCASDQHRYPSLAARPAEARSWAEPKAPPPVAPAADPTLDARIATAKATLAGVARDFDSADRRAAPLLAAARGQAAGSELWIAAQSALADLDAHRAAASDAANMLEDLASTRALAGLPDYPALEAARVEASALLDREAARIATMQAELPAG